MSVYNTERLFWVRTMRNVLDREVMAKVDFESWDEFGNGKVGTKWYKIQMHRQHKQQPRARNGSSIELPHCRDLWVMGGQGEKWP